ncbi:MAG: sporulation integral membrane protein YtvI [Clostridiaceae bacterium]
MNVEKRRNFIIQFAYLFIIGLISFFLAKYVVPLFGPFLIGLVIAIMVRSVSKLIPVKGLGLRVVHIISLILFYLLLVALLLLGGTKIADLIRTFFNRLPDLYMKEIQPAISDLMFNITDRFPNLREFAEASYQSINQTLLNFVEKASNTVINSLTGVAGTLTSLVLKTVFIIVSSVMFTLDLDRIEAFLRRQMSDRTLHIYENIIYNIGHTAFRFIRAYLIIIGVTFIELSIGFSILGLSNAIVLAFLIALMDSLPVIGTGTVMIPLVVYNLILGNFQLGIGLFILYAIIFVVRQSIEPKVVGDQIGLHPIIILMCLYVGVRLFGIVGMFILPLAITIFKKLNDDKVINVLR